MVDNVPYDEAVDHGDGCSAYPTEEAKDGLARCCQGVNHFSQGYQTHTRGVPMSLLWVMPIAIIIMAHTRRCSIKNSCVGSRNATIPTVMVAMATRRPKTDSWEPKKFEKLRSPLPSRSQRLVAGKCSASFLFFHPWPTKTTLPPRSKISGDSSALESAPNTLRTHFLRRRASGTIKCFLAIDPSRVLSSAKAARSRTASPVACICHGQEGSVERCLGQLGGGRGPTLPVSQGRE